MRFNIFNPTLFIVVSSLLLLTACGGPRLNRKHQPPVEVNPILVADFDAFNIQINQLLIRNGQYTWAKDANWDEYILQIATLSNTPIVFENILLIDAFGDQVTSLNERRELNKATRNSKRKYKNHGYKIKFGAGSTHMTTASLSGALGAGLAAGTVTTTGSIGTLTGAGVGVAVAVPALVITGVVKIVNNSKVNNFINKRYTALPITLHSEVKIVDLFYPATPVPQTLRIDYQMKGNFYQAEVDLTVLLADLHLKPNK